jgi:hypothetical protein
VSLLPAPQPLPHSSRPQVVAERPQHFMSLYVADNDDIATMVLRHVTDPLDVYSVRLVSRVWNRNVDVHALTKAFVVNFEVIHLKAFAVNVEAIHLYKRLHVIFVSTWISKLKMRGYFRYSRYEFSALYCAICCLRCYIYKFNVTECFMLDVRQRLYELFGYDNVDVSDFIVRVSKPLYYYALCLSDRKHITDEIVKSTISDFQKSLCKLGHKI